MAPRITYDSNQSLREARKRYFEANHFGDDGGYSKKWVPLELGPIKFAIPNTPGRVKAVRYHDLHHIVTGYQTDWIGEFEISAWEVASSCRDFAAAWILNLSGLAAGICVAPRRISRAFIRGRHSRNLYPDTFNDSLLDAEVGATRQRLGLDAAATGSPTDWLALLAWVLTGMLMIAGVLAATLGPLVFIVMLLWP